MDRRAAQRTSSTRGRVGSGGEGAPAGGGLACPPAGSRRAGPEPAAPRPRLCSVPTRSVQGKASGPTGTGCARFWQDSAGTTTALGPGARCPCLSQGSGGGLRSLRPRPVPAAACFWAKSCRGPLCTSCRDRLGLLPTAGW